MEFNFGPPIDIDQSPQVNAAGAYVPIQQLVNTHAAPMAADLDLLMIDASGDPLALDKVGRSTVSANVPPQSTSEFGLALMCPDGGELSISCGVSVAGDPQPDDDGKVRAPCLLTNPASITNNGTSSIMVELGLVQRSAAHGSSPSPPKTIAGDTLTLDPGSTIDFGLNVAPRLASRPEGSVEAIPEGHAGVPADWSSISPRIGLTYEVGDGTLLKANYALYADQLPAGFGATPSNAAESYRYFYFTGDDTSDRAAVDPLLPAYSGSEPPVDYDSGSPLTDEVIMGGSHQLTRDFVVGADFTFSRRADTNWSPPIIVDGGQRRPIRCDDFDASGASVAPPLAVASPAGESKRPKWLWGGIVGLLALIVIVIAVALSGGGDDEPTAAVTVPTTVTTSTVTPTTPGLAVTSSTVASSVTSSSVPPSTEPAPTFDGADQDLVSIFRDVGFSDTQMRRLLDAGVADDLRDWIYSLLGVQPGDPGADVDVRRVLAMAFQVSGVVANRLWNESVFECRELAGDRLTVCADSANPVPGGDLIVIAVQHDAPVPLDPGDRQYVYAAVFDSDGDAANDFVPSFDWDFFQGADRWYQLMTGATGYEISVIQWTGDSTVPFSSAARAVIQGDTVVWFIPADEFTSSTPLYRVSAFRHDGTFAPEASAGDVNGADPTRALSAIEASGISLE